MLRLIQELSESVALRALGQLRFDDLASLLPDLRGRDAQVRCQSIHHSRRLLDARPSRRGDGKKRIDGS